FPGRPERLPEPGLHGRGLHFAAGYAAGGRVAGGGALRVFLATFMDRGTGALLHDLVGPVGSNRGFLPAGRPGADGAIADALQGPAGLGGVGPVPGRAAVPAAAG